MAMVYMVPGLGTDARIFSKLIPLLNKEGKEYLCLEYQDPSEASETIEDYAKRLVEQLPPTEEPPILIGMSLGGAVVTEMAKLMSCKKVVIISSIKHKSERPFLFNIAQILPIHLLAPAWFIRWIVPFFARLLGICDKEDSLLIKKMLYDRTALHFAWGRRAIVQWKNNTYPNNCIHINGTKDHIFYGPQHYATHLIKGGTHNMVLDRAEEIAAIINKEFFLSS